MVVVAPYHNDKMNSSIGSLSKSKSDIPSDSQSSLQAEDLLQQDSYEFEEEDAANMPRRSQDRHSKSMSDLSRSWVCEEEQLPIVRSNFKPQRKATSSAQLWKLPTTTQTKPAWMQKLKTDRSLATPEHSTDDKEPTELMKKLHKQPTSQWQRSGSFLDSSNSVTTSTTTTTASETAEEPPAWKKKLLEQQHQVKPLPLPAAAPAPAPAPVTPPPVKATVPASTTQSTEDSQPEWMRKFQSMKFAKDEKVLEAGGKQDPSIVRNSNGVAVHWMSQSCSVLDVPSPASLLAPAEPKAKPSRASRAVIQDAASLLGPPPPKAVMSERAPVLLVDAAAEPIKKKKKKSKKVLESADDEMWLEMDGGQRVDDTTGQTIDCHKPPTPEQPKKEKTKKKKQSMVEERDPVQPGPLSKSDDDEESMAPPGLTYKDQDGHSQDSGDRNEGEEERRNRRKKKKSIKEQSEREKSLKKKKKKRSPEEIKQMLRSFLTESSTNLTLSEEEEYARLEHSTRELASNHIKRKIELKEIEPENEEQATTALQQKLMDLSPRKRASDADMALPVDFDDFDASGIFSFEDDELMNVARPSRCTKRGGKRPSTRRKKRGEVSESESELEDLFQVSKSSLRSDFGDSRNSFNWDPNNGSQSGSGEFSFDDVESERGRDGYSGSSDVEQSFQQSFNDAFQQPFHFDGFAHDDGCDDNGSVMTEAEKMLYELGKKTKAKKDEEGRGRRERSVNLPTGAKGREKAGDLSELVDLAISKKKKSAKERNGPIKASDDGERRTARRSSLSKDKSGTAGRRSSKLGQRRGSSRV